MNFFPTLKMNQKSYLDAGTTEQRSVDARRTINSGTKLIYEIIKSTLGPSGMTKLLTCGSKIKVTNDGATILKNLLIDSASARILIESSIGQDWEEGDGTTTIAILAALLVDEAYKLNDTHPIQIIKGYEIALEKSLEIITNNSFIMKDDDFLNLAKTTLSSKILRCDLDKFSNICVDAINIIEDRENLNLINFIKVEGEISGSNLVSGFILDKNTQLDTVYNPKILIANTAMDQDKIKISGAQVNVKSITELSKIEEAERERMQEKVDSILKENINVFINRQIMYDYFLRLFKDRDVIAIENADFDGVERLANILNGKIVSNFDCLTDCYGTCEKIENVTVGEKRMIKFTGLQKGACTIIIRGSTKEMQDEIERSLHDALCVLMKVRKEKKIIYGGGSVEIEIGLALNNLALKTEGKESSAIMGFSNALQKIPQIIAENCGMDGEAIKSQLRALHTKNKRTFGVSLKNDGVGCMKEENIIESLRIKRRIFTAAVEAACQIIKCDGIIRCKPQKRDHP